MDLFAGSRELSSSSHELSTLHPTRLSRSTSCATPKAAQPPGMRKKRLEGWTSASTINCEELEHSPAAVLRGALVVLASSLATGSLS
jgi:hypothetical protein